MHSSGFEPPTFGFGDQRSIQLSYECERVPNLVIKLLNTHLERSFRSYIACLRLKCDLKASPSKTGLNSRHFQGLGFCEILRQVESQD
jgi:hypothetical protein